MREIRRRTRVVGVFPDGRSALMLEAARLRPVAGTKWVLRRYLDMDRLKDLAELDREESSYCAARPHGHTNSCTQILAEVELRAYRKSPVPSERSCSF